jgi:DMSO/TMAO reductase YedYZ molybdopterin-dependent catalytic subunit
VRAFGALTGIAAAAVALAVAELVAVAAGARSAPLVAVGGVVVDNVPASVKEFAVRVFYTYDKLALQIGTGVILAGLAALVGVLALRSVWYGLGGVAVLGLVGLVAALTRPGATWTYPLPSVLGAFAGAGILVLLLRRLRPLAETHPDSAQEPPDSAQERPDPAQRRQFLRLAGGALGGAAVVGVGGRWLSGERGVTTARRAVALPAADSLAPALPADADLKLPRLAPFVTSNRDFYLIDTALVAPQVDPASWRLKIHGRVRNPMRISYEELLARPMIERYVTLACVSNYVGGDLIGNARWLGVPLKGLLDEADPEDGADQVVSRSVDGFTAGTPTAVLRDGRDAMLAVGMNGEPLPVKHGFPVRMVVPGLYGYVSATKWLSDLELTTFADYDAYWIKRGWAQQAPIKTESRIDTPADGRVLTAGQVTVAGVAWAQHRGVSRVEVRVDDGAWQDAKLAAVPSIDTWRQWSLPWQAAPGKHRLQVRASDNAGTVQTEEQQSPAPDGATGWHTIEVTVS